MDWKEAEDKLVRYEGYIADMPKESGWFISSVLGIIRKRFDGGERSKALYNEIMDLEE